MCAVSLACPWFYLLFFQQKLSPIGEAVISGLAIVGSAFLLSWIAEVAQLEIPKSLAIALVAIVAVLPEYAVDMYLAGKAGRNPVFIPYVAANMTGANRLLIGIGWPSIVFWWWLSSRKKSFSIKQHHFFEFILLFLVTLFALFLPFSRQLSLLDGSIFIAVFLFYMFRASKGEVEEPELEGAAAAIEALPRGQRWIVIFSVFLFSSAAIVTAAKPFADSLIQTGRLLHIGGFLVIQIFAPLASEMPEFLIAGILAFAGNPNLGFATLLSSKLEQWTLLVGMIPFVYGASLVTGGHQLHPLPLDLRQCSELFLTAAQSLFALILVADFELSLGDAFILFALYIPQFFFPGIEAREWYAVGYLILTAGIFLFKRSQLKKLFERIKWN
jgi:cation:H+ antiporter